MSEEIPLGQGQMLRVDAQDSDALVVVSTWQPSGRPGPAHLHPAQRETFDVLEGVLAVELDGRALELTAGERLVVEQGVVHRMWNAADVVTRATWRVEPPLRTLALWRAMGGGTLSRLLALARFRRELRLARPPRG